MGIKYKLQIWNQETSYINAPPLDSIASFVLYLKIVKGLRAVGGFSMMEQVRLCAVWPMENWLGSSFNQIPGWITVREFYSRALEQGLLL